MRLYPLYILDLDGTLFRGNQALPGAVEVVKELKDRGAAIRYLTNNSSLTRDSYRDKLVAMGFSVEVDEVYSSGSGVASHCLQQVLTKLFVLGEPGLVATLRDAGLDVLNAAPDNIVSEKSDSRADAVVVGIHKGFTYAILSAAMQQILQGAGLIATNTDATYPMEEGKLVPGAGAIVASIERCSGQEAFVIGKPNPLLIELVMKDASISARDTLVVGDRYETDIESGIRAGADTHLVLTGVTKKSPPDQSFSEDLRGLL